MKKTDCFWFVFFISGNAAPSVSEWETKAKGKMQRV
jgi:hypothetical protein